MLSYLLELYNMAILLLPSQLFITYITYLIIHKHEIHICILRYVFHTTIWHCCSRCNVFLHWTVTEKVIILTTFSSLAVQQLYSLWHFHFSGIIMSMNCNWLVGKAPGSDARIYAKMFNTLRPRQNGCHFVWCPTNDKPLSAIMMP